MTEISRRPSRIGVGLSLGAGATALAVTLVAPSVATTLAGVGFVALAAGVVRGVRAAVTGGTALLVGGTLLSAGGSPSPLLPVLGAVAAVVAWDIGENAICLGEQVGREARTLPAELTHGAVGSVVGLAAAAGGFLVFTVTSRGQPLPALVLLLVAAVALAAALRR